jgi:anaerobic selenocysteine-containing dehydrogenase
MKDGGQVTDAVDRWQCLVSERNETEMTLPNLKHTFCRICEPCCPLNVEFDDQKKIVRLHPDLGHVSGSIACHKGLSFLDVHNDPERVNWPLKRVNARSDEQGDFVETDWDSAMEEIGARLNLLRDRYGPNSIAIYYGNAWAFTNPTALLAYETFRDLLDTKMVFSSNTQDTANKFAAAGPIYGSTSAVMIPDLRNTDYLLCLGGNPRVSRWTTISMPNDDLAVLKQIRRRGGKVRFVNPRRIESSDSDTGPTILIKPGADVYFLSALLNEIEGIGGFNDVLVSRYGKHIEELKAFLGRYSAERVANITGVSVASIKEVAREIIAAKSATVYMATGVNQSRQGILCHWLVEMINFCTGNLGKVGGTYKPTGLFNVFPPCGGVMAIETSIGSFELPDPLGYSVLPAALMSQLIINKDIRALLVLGGNPLLTVGGEERLREACRSLDLMVSVDIYRQATSEVADYILPSTDWLEHMDINLFGSGMQPSPFVQYTDAMEPPVAGRRNGWWVLARLAKAMGLSSPLDANPDEIDGHGIVNGLLAARDSSIEKMRALPRHTFTIEEEPPSALFEKCLQHADKKVDCCPTAFVEAGLFERCETIFTELTREPTGTLKLISMRTPYMQNSWLTNISKFRLGKHSSNSLNMSEVDAVALGLYQGDEIRAFNRFGSIETEVFINNDLRPGVVAMTHGYGHQRTFGLSVAKHKPGANCNALMPTDRDTIEPLSYMSWMSGVPIKVEKLRLGDDHAPPQVSGAASEPTSAS